MTSERVKLYKFQKANSEVVLKDLFSYTISIFMLSYLGLLLHQMVIM